MFWAPACLSQDPDGVLASADEVATGDVDEHRATSSQGRLPGRWPGSLSRLGRQANRLEQHRADAYGARGGRGWSIAGRSAGQSSFAVQVTDVHRSHVGHGGDQGASQHPQGVVGVGRTVHPFGQLAEQRGLERRALCFHLSGHIDRREQDTPGRCSRLRQRREDIRELNLLAGGAQDAGSRNRLSHRSGAGEHPVKGGLGRLAHLRKRGADAGAYGPGTEQASRGRVLVGNPMLRPDRQHDERRRDVPRSSRAAQARRPPEVRGAHLRTLRSRASRA